MRSRPLFALATAALLALSCGGAGGLSVALLDVAPGERVAGIVQLRARVESDVPVSAVDFALDGAVFATAARPPWVIAWNSLSAENGGHALTARARDAAGGSGTSAPIAVSVLNGKGVSISIHTLLGVPAGPGDPGGGDGAWLSIKPQYVVSYDGSRRVPGWVSWELNARWLGPVPRQDDFRPDDTLPPRIPQAQLSDYAGSGWDRGHLCPSEDRTATVADNRSTFYLTNVVPQADGLNGGPWEKLEFYLRGLAFSGSELSVVAGGVFAGPPRSIGPDAVSVPSATFKVALVLDRPGQGIADVTSRTRVIAVIMPNERWVDRSADWRSFRVRPREVESATGLRLYPDVPHEVREVLLDRFDDG